VITNWSSAESGNGDREKVPTKIYYDDDDHVEWGYEVPNDVTPIQWFKLLLIKKSDLPDHLKNCQHLKEARELLLKQNKQPVEVIADYLRRLWDHSVQRMKAAVGESTYQRTHKQIIMTLPAIWPQYAQDEMTRAARMAGIVIGDTELHFVPEPEAAARATLVDNKGAIELLAGDTFTVVDCGGGTVDIISYIVDQVDPFEVRECVGGQGDLCGAQFLDEEFENLLKGKFGPKQKKKLSSASLQRIIDKDWENGIKRGFDSSKKDYQIAIPFECLDFSQMKGITTQPTVKLPGNEISETFVSNFEKTLVMVKNQIKTMTDDKKLGAPKVWHLIRRG